MQTDNLKIEFIGTGGAFDPKFLNSSAIITIHGQKILLDCGHSIFPALLQAGLATEFDGLILTHFHDDHAGSLSAFLIYNNLFNPQKKIKFYYPDDQFLDQAKGYLSYSLSDPDIYADWLPLSDLPGVGSINTVNCHVEGMQTYAYYFTHGNQSIVYSGDNGNVRFLMDQLDPLGLPNPILFHDTWLGETISAHTHYTDLHPHLERMRIYGYHCDPTMSPPDNRVPLVHNHPEWFHDAFKPVRETSRS